MERLALSIWPFVLLAPGEVLGALLIRRNNPIDRLGLPGPLDEILVVLGGLVLSFACIVGARRLIERSRSVRWRSVLAAIGIYVTVAVLSGLFMVVILVDRGPTGQPAVLTVLYMITRPVNVLILAVVVQQVRDGVATTRAVDAITRDRLLLVRRTNEMLEAAELDLRAESLRMFASQVARPLRRIVREGPSLSSSELADRLDVFIEERLRPMAHVLHPVSVRLGLISAMRSLNPEVAVDATATVERMDADGVLLDDEVRLQLYRWIRAGLPSQGPSRAALVIRGRELQVSLHPAESIALDAVQTAAGLRLVGAGLVSVPLRGQVAELDVPGSPPPEISVRSARYRLRDLVTVRLPSRLLLVAVLSIGSAPLQFVVYRWSPSVGTVLASAACALSPIAMAAILGRLAPAHDTVAGAWRVIAEWLAIAAAAGLGLVLVGIAYGVLPMDPREWLLIFFRMSYRYAIPGLLVTLSHGLAVQARRRLARAQDSLKVEEERRVAILAEARQLDRDVAEALHRNVQGRLAAAVIMLRLGQRDEAWAQVMEMASVEVPWLLERMGEPHVGRVLVSDPPMGLTVIQVDDVPMGQTAFALLARATGEVALNARRHGGASTLVISVRIDEGCCRIVCEDDGAGISDSATPGLGSRLLDETAAALGGSWRAESAEPGCRVILDLPASVLDDDRATARVRASSGV